MTLTWTSLIHSMYGIQYHLLKKTCEKYQVKSRGLKYIETEIEHIEQLPSAVSLHCSYP